MTGTLRFSQEFTRLALIGINLTKLTSMDLNTHSAADLALFKLNLSKLTSIDLKTYLAAN